MPLRIMAIPQTLNLLIEVRVLEGHPIFDVDLKPECSDNKLSNELFDQGEVNML